MNGSELDKGLPAFLPCHCSTWNESMMNQIGAEQRLMGSQANQEANRENRRADAEWMQLFLMLSWSVIKTK